MNPQEIMLKHSDRTGHKKFQILSLGKKKPSPNVKCKECKKIVWH